MTSIRLISPFQNITKLFWEKPLQKVEFTLNKSLIHDNQLLNRKFALLMIFKILERSKMYKHSFRLHTVIRLSLVQRLDLHHQWNLAWTICRYLILLTEHLELKRKMNLYLRSTLKQDSRNYFISSLRLTSRKECS